MFAIEPPINPPCDYWEEYQKPKFIMNKIQEICKNIYENGDNTNFQDILDYLYEHIEDNFGDYYSPPEVDYDLQ